MVEEESTFETWQERLDAATHATLNEGEMVLRWVSVLEVINSEGERNLFTLTSADMELWDTTGLLHSALKRQESFTAALEFKALMEDEEEDE